MAIARAAGSTRSPSCCRPARAANAAWRRSGPGWRCRADRGLPVQLFRLAGIYGPGRNAIETLRAGRGRRVDKPGQVFSRIHVADIATVLEASIARPNPGRAYNLCDDDPAPPQEVIAHASGLLGQDPLPLVPFEEAELSEMARSFYRDNKRVSNARIKQELGVELAYPDYKTGLAALLGGGDRKLRPLCPLPQAGSPDHGRESLAGMRAGRLRKRLGGRSKHGPSGCGARLRLDPGRAGHGRDHRDGDPAAQPGSAEKRTRPS